MTSTDLTMARAAGSWLGGEITPCEPRAFGLAFCSEPTTAVNCGCFIVFLHQDVICRSGAGEIDAGLRWGDCFESTGLSVPVGHQSWPCAKVDAEIGFDKAVNIAYIMRYGA